jgi:hypothetical protein
MFRYLALLSLVTVNAVCSGQENELPGNKIWIELFAAGGRSIFSTNVLKSQTEYPTPEYRLGLSFYRSFGNTIELQVRPSIGVKKKAKVQNVLSPFNFLEESTKFDYGFAEISILANYRLGRKGMIKSGLNSRFFFPSNNIPYGFLGSKFDMGVLVGGALKLSNRIAVGAECIIGLTKVLNLNYFDSNLQPQSGLLSVRNQVGQITLSYSLSKRK